MSFKTVFFTTSGIWVTDGTVAGTQQLEAFAQEDAGPTPVVLGTDVLFDLPITFTYGIGVTNGTTGGTTLVQPPNANSTAPSPGYDMSYPVSIGNKVIAEANLFGALLVTNGTAAGTSLLSFPTVPAPFTWSILSSLYSLGTKVIFNAGNTHPTLASEVDDLWVSDGTSAGTKPLVVPGENNGGLNPYNFTVFGNKAVFLGDDSNSNFGLWVTDGTVAGTSEITTPQLSSASDPSGGATFFLAFGSDVLFRASGTDNTSSLWITNGTDAGTREINIPLPPTEFGTPNSLFPIPVVAFGNQALFLGDDGTKFALWVTDGTTAGTHELATPGLQIDSSAPGSSGSINPTDFFAWDGKVLFQGKDTAGRVGLWITDGTSAGTSEILPANAYQLGLNPSEFSLAGSEVVFQATDAAGHVGLWVTDGTTAGTQELQVNSAATTGNPGQWPQDLTSFNTDLLTTTQITLHGISSQYIVADNNGSVYLQDTVAGRDGTQTLSGVTEIVFTNGTGVFDSTGTAEDVARLYGAALHRAPDVQGLAGWTTAIDGSTFSLTAVANDFAASPEFIQDYGALSNADFVNRLYENVLGRPADAAGAQGWTNALAAGMSRGTALLGFAESQENEANTISTAGDPNNAEVYRLYETTLGRAPDPGGLASWSGLLASGGSSLQVADALVSSPEFLQDYGALSPTDFVTALYRNTLHRAPDAGGLQGWVGALASGTSRASVVIGFADSLEYRGLTAGATHANWVFIPS
jgi:ELWxxDGT repeat protein